MSERGMMVVRRAMKYGLKPHAAAGMAGNFQQESEFNTEAHNPKENAWGLAQWRRERLDGLKQYAKEKKKDAKDPFVQIDYAFKEMKSMPGFIEELNATKSPYEAAMLFGKKFEKPKVVEASRGKYAEGIYTAYRNSKDQSPLVFEDDDGEDVLKGGAEKDSPVNPFEDLVGIRLDKAGGAGESENPFDDLVGVNLGSKEVKPAQDSIEGGLSIPDRIGFGAMNPIHAAAQKGYNAVDAASIPLSFLGNLAGVDIDRSHLGKDYNKKLQERQREFNEASPAARAGEIDWYALAGQLGAETGLGFVPGMRGFVGGATGAVLDPQTDGSYSIWDDAIKALYGGGAGKMVDKGLEVFSRGLQGFQGSPPAAWGSKSPDQVYADQAKLLNDRGVRMTPGQVMGKEEAITESKRASVPFSGKYISRGVLRSWDDLNIAAYNDVLKNVGESVPPGVYPGRESIEKIGEVLEKAYSKAVTGLKFDGDAAFRRRMQSRIGEIRQIKGSPSAIRKLVGPKRTQNAMATGMPAEQKGIIFDLMQGKILTDQEVKDQLKNLNDLGKEYRRHTDLDNRAIGEIIESMKDDMLDLIEKQDPDKYKQLLAADRGYAEYSILRDASSDSTAVNGVFDPETYSKAVRSADSAVQRRRYAKGKALMQNLSDAGMNVLGESTPDSARLQRTSASSVLDHALGLAAALPVKGMYSEPSSRLIQKMMLTPRNKVSQRAGRALAKTIPLASLYSGSIAGSLYADDEEGF